MRGASAGYSRSNHHSTQVAEKGRCTDHVVRFIEGSVVTGGGQTNFSKRLRSKNEEKTARRRETKRISAFDHTVMPRGRTATASERKDHPLNTGWRWAALH